MKGGWLLRSASGVGNGMWSYLWRGRGRGPAFLPRGLATFISRPRRQIATLPRCCHFYAPNPHFFFCLLLHADPIPFSRSFRSPYHVNERRNYSPSHRQPRQNHCARPRQQLALPEKFVCTAVLKAHHSCQLAGTGSH